MLIPAVISLMISTIFLNFSFSAQNAILISDQGEPTKVSQVLGLSGVGDLKGVLAGQYNGLNIMMAKAAEESKPLIASRIFQMPQFDQPMRKTSAGQENQPEAKRSIVIDDKEFQAENGVILGLNGSLYFAKRPDRTWPIASITKLFTVYTFLDFNPGWEKSYEIKAADKREGGKIYLFTGARVTGQD